MSQQATEVSRLSAILDQRRDELESVAGVVGAGIGLASGDELERVVIQIFVRSPTLVDAVQAKVTAIVGEEIPIETTFMPTPAAQGEKQEGGN